MQLKKLFDHLSISSKLSLLTASLIVITFLFLWLIINNTLIHLLNTQTDMLGDTTARQMAHASAELLLAEDLLSLKVIVNQVSQAENIARAQIRNSNDQIVADSINAAPRVVQAPETQPPDSQSANAQRPTDKTLGNTADSTTHDTSSSARPNITQDDSQATTPKLYQGRFSPQHVVYSAPIVFQGVTAGHADVLLDKRMIGATIERTLTWMSAAFGGLLVLSLPLFYLLGRYWAEPIKQLMFATQALNAGELKTRLRHTRQDELGALMNSFNEMADSLESREQLKTTFYRYVGSGIANQVLDEPNNPVVPLRPITATVVFIDIVSFTQLCEDLSPENVGKVLTHYYDCITQCCAEFGGIVDKFMGDGALIIFGASGHDGNHALNALLATALFLKIANGTTALPAHSKRTKLHYRISLHTGHMLAGTLGESERLQYTVIGDAVNVAARLCQSATPNTPVLSSDCRQHLPTNETPFLNCLGLWPVRGRTTGIEVLEFNPKQLPVNWKILVSQRARILERNRRDATKTPTADTPNPETPNAHASANNKELATHS